jgi:N-acylglucosamine 2-epimerase
MIDRRRKTIDSAASIFHPMSMTPQRLAELRDVYRDGLLSDVIPFWLRYGLDRECGGLISGLGRDGAAIDTDKAVWLQGRATWTFATLYNTVERRPEWLEASRHCLDFLRRHCAGPGGKLYFTVTREGRPLRMRRYFSSETFACIGNAAYAKASGESRAAEEAAKHFSRYLRGCFTAPDQPAKTDPVVRPMQGIPAHMGAIYMAQEARAHLGDIAVEGSTCTEWIDRSIGAIEKYFYKPELGALLETVGPKGEIIDHFDGRTLNPGHAIECAWFILHEAKLRGRDPCGRGAGTRSSAACFISPTSRACRCRNTGRR